MNNFNVIRIAGQRERGATIIEVMISVLVISIGLLGIAGTQTLGLANTSSALHRSYAAHLVYEYTDIARSNRQIARVAGSVFSNFDSDTDDSDVTDSCAEQGGGCTATEMALTQLSNFRDRVQDVLPGGQVVVTRVLNVFTIDIRWSDARSDMVRQNAGPANGLAADQIQFFTSFSL